MGGAKNTTINGVIGTGAGTLTKQDGGTLTLTGINTYTGITTINGGTLEIGGSGQLGSGSYAGAISNSGTLAYSSSASQTLSGVISGNGGLTKSGNGTLTLSGGNTYTGTTTINGGTLQLSMGPSYDISHVGSNVVINDGGTLLLNSFFSTGFALGFPGSQTPASITVNSGGTFDKNNQVTYIQNLTLEGTGKVIGAGAGVSDDLQLSGNVTATSTALGAPSITSLNLVAGTYTDAGNARTFNVTHGAGSTSTVDLTIGAIGQQTSGPAASLIKAGNGTLAVIGTSSYTGGTLITAGALALGHATDTLADTGAVTVDGATAVLAIGGNSDTVGAVSLKNGASIAGTGGTLTGTSYAVESGSVSAILGGSAALTKSTDGTVILSGANTYTGSTTVSGGTLEITNTGELSGTSWVLVAGGATLKNDGTVSGSLIVDVGGVLSGVGAVTGSTTVLGTHTPGDSPGTQSFSAGLTYDATSTLEWEFSGNALTLRGTDYDGINLTGGDLTIVDAATLRISNYLGTAVDYTAADWDVHRTFNVISLTGGGGVTGSFTLDDTTFAPGTEGSWSVVSNAGGVDLKWTAIPEPATFSLLGATALVALLRRRMYKAE